MMMRFSDGKATTLPPFRQRVAALKYIPRLLGMIWRTHRGYASAVFALRISRSFVPIATLWVGKLIIDGVIAAAGHQTTSSHVLRLVALEFAIVTLGEALSRAAVIESLLGELFSNKLSADLMSHAATLDLQQIEDPTFYDKMERARQGSLNRVAMYSQSLGLIETGISLMSLTVVLTVQSPMLVLLLFVAAVPGFVGEGHFASLNYAMMTRMTAERRELDYLRLIAASNETAKEVRLFGIAPWIIGRFEALSDLLFLTSKSFVYTRASVTMGLSILSSIGYYLAAVIMILRAVAGTITIGTLIFLIGSFQRCRGSVQALLTSISGIYEQTLYLNDYFEFMATRPSIVSKTGARAVPRPIRKGLVFESVSFKYPGSDRWAVRNVSFALRPGERIALVGENGSGKSTITKIMARLYEPTEGRVLLDGVDLREYDLDDFRRTIGAVFQDFVRYDLRMDENIGIGEIESVRGEFDRQWRGDAPTDSTPAAVLSAAEKSLADSLLPRLPAGYRQMLGRRFQGGVNLSGGEWQKIAIARAYMREAQLLILDEPTAALDARAEYEVFKRFVELAEDKGAMIVSHRFSTVRMAGRIIVLENGLVVEDGSHQELITLGRQYADLFELQAKGYR